MALSSMTGFAREAGLSGPWRWAWEVKSVNAKGLDIRLKLPAAFESLGEEARGRVGRRVHRGTVFASLAAVREAALPQARVNAALLDALVAALAPYGTRAGLRPPSLDGLLGVRGVVEIIEAEAEAVAGEAAADVLDGLDRALDGLVGARRAEGEALKGVLDGQCATIARLARAADECPARQPPAIRARLARQVALLVEAGRNLDPDRLHQEAVLLAAKADIREEIDRLHAHVAAAGALLTAGGPVGRRLDFLAQEFSREANTLCAKAADPALTAIGLDLKTEVERFREQAQNVE